jgi:ParB family chromosome partitioning protein
MTTSAVDNTLRQLPVGEIKPSPLNHRKRFDEVKLQELAESIRQKGLVQPVVVRPKGAGWELIVGHRRLKAAAIAGLEAIPAMIRELDDESVVELQVIENVQRDDVHPMEEAAGYRYLIEKKRLDVPQIAAKVGRSVKYIYDRVKLLQLIPEAQRLFLEDRFTAGHAVILARLKPSDQERAIEPGRNKVALWEREEADLFSPALSDAERAALRKTTKDGPYLGLKARSVRELQQWVDDHVRFDPTSADLPQLFPETASALENVRARVDAKVVAITYDHFLQPEARDQETRTFGPMSWRRADGEFDSSTCEHSVLGVVAAGPHRGEAFDVCVQKKKCLVHWGKEIRATARRAKQAASGKPGTKGLADRRRAEQERQERERKKEQAERDRFEKAKPALQNAVAEAVRSADLSTLARVLDGEKPDRKSPVPIGSTFEDLVRYLVFQKMTVTLRNVWYRDQWIKDAKAQLGIDARKIIDTVAPVEPVQTSAQPKAAVKKKVAKKTGGRKT